MEPSKKIDPYSVLNLPSDATQSEIKKARDRLARNFHPDRMGGGGMHEEMMKNVNQAFEILSDLKMREQYDSTRDDYDELLNTERSINARAMRKRLYCGKKWSDGLISKINFWKSVGPKDENTEYNDLNKGCYYNVVSKNKISQLDEFKKLLDSETPMVYQNLSRILPEKIWKWSFTKINFSKNQINLLNAYMWDLDLGKSSEKKIDTQGVKFNLENDLNFDTQNINFKLLEKDLNFVLNINPIECNFPKTNTIKQIIYDYYNGPGSLHSSESIIYLCPNTSDMRKTLGIIPGVSKKGSFYVRNDCTNCSDCNNQFGLTLWKYNCMSCEKYFCDDCLKVQRAPDYVDPVKTCLDCEIKNQKKVGATWVSFLNHSPLRLGATSTCLALVDEMGYATRKDFLRWSEEFLYESNYSLAFQCIISGGGDLIEFAKKMVVRNELGYAKGCLARVKKTFIEWENLGDSFAKEHPILSVLCYQKSHISVTGYVIKAVEYYDHSISYDCIFLGFKLSKNNPNFLSTVLEYAKPRKAYGLILFCLILGKYSSSQWVDIINDIYRWCPEFESFIKEYSLKFDITKIEFKKDRDHFRWQFLGPKDCRVWLGYLEKHLESGAYQPGIEDSIFYFRDQMKDENFMIHRDYFASIGDHFKMLMCHRMIPNALSWDDLGKKLMKTNESASLASYMCSTNDLEKLGEKFLNEGKISLGLRSYLQAGNILKIKELSKSGQTNTRMLCCVQIWRKDPYDIENVLNLCRELKNNPSNTLAVQNIVVKYLKNFTPDESVPFYKMLVEVGVSDIQLLGLLETVYNLKNLKFNDLMWFNKICKSLEKNFKTKLINAISRYSYKDVFDLSDLMHPLTLFGVEDVLDHFKADKINHCPLKSICLVVKALSRMVNPTWDSILKAMNDLTEALLGDSSEDAIIIFSKIMDKISSHQELLSFNWKVRGDEMGSIKQPRKSEFIDKLQRTPELKMLSMYEKAIREMPPFEAALSHVDSSMAIGDASGRVGGFLSAALELLKLLEVTKKGSNHAFAYRRAIVDLVEKAYSIGRGHLCPATRLYMLRASIAILTNTFQMNGKYKDVSSLNNINKYKFTSEVGERDQLILEQLYNEADHLSKVAPMVMSRLLQTYDLIYLDCMYRKMMTFHLDNKRRTDPNPIYQYHLLEGTLSWMNKEKFDFEIERERTMQALLRDKSYSIEDVEELMSWPAIKRDEEGWLPAEYTPLYLSGKKKFSKVNGIRFNKKSGEVSFLFGEAKTNNEALFDENDVSDVMKLGVTEALFSLDEVDSNMPYHPFQKKRCLPESLLGTNYEATMLNADLVMKWLSMGVEVSAMAPFAIRDAEEGLYKRMPKKLRKKFIELKNKIPETTNKVNRFWIQAGDITYFSNESKDEITYFLGECKMEVKKHLMVRDEYGKLVDSEKDEDIDSKEAKFAKLMTDEYLNLGQIFPEFLKLIELVKLQSLAYLAQNFHHNIKIASDEAVVSMKEVKEVLRKIKAKVDYPLTDQVDNFVSKSIKNSGYNSSQYSFGELHKLRADTLRHCQDADIKTIKNIADNLGEIFHTNMLEWDIKKWLNNDDSDYLIATLKCAGTHNKKMKLLKICETIESYGIASKPNLDSFKEKCPWVPSTYKIGESYRVYGGVSMSANLMPGGAIERSMGTANSLPPRSGGMGGPNARPYYVEGMGATGQIYGRSVGVDAITGNTYRILDVGTCIHDKYNANNTYKPDTIALWKTYVYAGRAEIHRYSRHTNGSMHFHYNNGISLCTDKKGDTEYYKAGDKSHRCG